MAPNRTYVSPKREAQSQETAQRILAAARELFARRGYAGTTIEAVAREAGVSVQSVYQRFTDKAGLIRAQLDDVDRAGDVGALRAATGDPRAPPLAQAEALARFIGRLGDVAGPLLAAARASNDPQLRAFAEGGAARHRGGTARLAAQWAERGLLRPGLAPDRAGAILAATCSIGMFAELREDHGWSLEEAEAWIVEAIGRLLLA